MNRLTLPPAATVRGHRDTEGQGVLALTSLPLHLFVCIHPELMDSEADSCLSSLATLKSAHLGSEQSPGTLITQAALIQTEEAGSRS